MIEVRGNLWMYKLPDGRDPVVRVITTNGTVKKNGECVMGRGCAFEAKGFIPNIASYLGDCIQRNGNHVYLLGTYKGAEIYSFPVKHNWYEKADLDLIARSRNELADLLDPIYLNDEGHVFVMPRPGCGNGQLKWEDVRPILEPILDDRFHVITF